MNKMKDMKKVNEKKNTFYDFSLSMCSNNNIIIIETINQEMAKILEKLKLKNNKNNLTVMKMYTLTLFLN